MAAGDDYYEDLLKIIVSYTGERNTAENICYASCLGAHGATLSDLNTLAGDIFTLWAAQIMTNVIESVILSLIEVADWTDADGLTGSLTGDTAGSLTGEYPPDQVASLVNYETLMRYRGGRGRMYLPQPNAAQLVSGDSWTTAHVTNVTDGITNVFNGINELSIGDDLLTVVLYHRAGSKVVEQGFEDVVAATCSPVPGTQRRRVRRVGHKR
jgi:hypothetical protein